MGESRVGSIIASKYRLDAELGRGGMGAVYRAYHLRVHKEFAIKLLLSGMLEHRSIASRFFLEAQAAGRIGHPGILDVYDVGEEPDGTPFIVMELLRGEPLSALVRRGPVEVDAACWIAMGVLDALEAAHRVGVIHRDVKPQNVFLTERDDASGVTRAVKLLDFGIAKFGGADGSSLTRSGEIIGSPLYMAPEQARGESDLDARADVWSVGAMLFEMLTGKCAHAAATPVAVLAKVLTEPAPAPSTKDDRVPSEVDEIVVRALRIHRAERFASAGEMRDALGNVRARLGTANQPPVLPRASTAPSSFQAGQATDRTPGAISSTVSAGAAGSTAPKGPWSSLVTDQTALGPPSVPPAPDGAAVVSAGEGRARSRRVAARLIAALAAVGGVASYFHFRGGDERGREDLTVLPLPTLAPVPEPAPAAPALASAAASLPSRVHEAGASPSPDPNAARPAAASPKCAGNEVVSHGHCCGRGLEWQGASCERPLATSF